MSIKRAPEAKEEAPSGATRPPAVEPLTASKAPAPSPEPTLIQVRIADLMPSRDNYRTVRTTGEKWERLLGSIQKKGILQPLSVRPNPHLGTREGPLGPIIITAPYEVLCGHRRLRAAQAAGLDMVRAYDHGEMSDEDAFDLMALDNEHEELTPLELGRMIAIWLDKYRQDTKAVAARLKMSERWVQRHAQIDRGLSAEWKAAAVAVPDGDQDEDRDLSRWTTAHWELIARLPRQHQDEAYAAYAKGRDWYEPAHWTVEELAEHLRHDRLPLARAPFDVATCDECVKRTDVQPLLWVEKDGDALETVTGKNAQCQDRRCYEKKTLAAQRAKFEAAVRQADEKYSAAHDVAALPVRPVPVSLVPVPKRASYDARCWANYHEGHAYDDKVKPVRKVYKDLVEADRVTVVREGTKGAVPAIVVAGGQGRQQHSLVWAVVKDKPKAESGRGGGPAETPAAKAKREAHERREAQIRKIKEDIIHAVGQHIARRKLRDVKDRPFATVATCCMVTGSFPEVDTLSKAWEPWVENLLNKRLHLAEADFAAWLLGEMWAAFQDHAKEAARGYYTYVEGEWPRVLVLGPLFGLNPMKDLQERMPKAEKEKPAKKVRENRDRGDVLAAGGDAGTCPVDKETGECVNDGDCSSCRHGVGEAEAARQKRPKGKGKAKKGKGKTKKGRK